MTLLNNNLVQVAGVINFNEISPDVRISFTLPQGNDNRILGRGNKGYTCREQPYVLTDYQVSFPSLKKEKADEIFNIFNDLKHQIKFFPFNDISDNYVLNWEKDAVTQSGNLVEILTSDPLNPDYQLCKKYTVGRQFSYKPIYYVPDEAEVSINDTDYPLGAADFNRQTGVVSNLGAGLTGAPFEIDLYYTLVRISSDLRIDYYYNEGLDNEGLDLDNEVTDEQLFTISFSMQEVRLNQILDYSNMLPDNSLEAITKFDFSCFVNGASRSERRYFNSYTQSGFVAQEDPANSRVTPEIQVPSRITKHKELIYFLTMFKACCGCAFNI